MQVSCILTITQACFVYNISLCMSRMTVCCQIWRGTRIEFIGENSTVMVHVPLVGKIINWWPLLYATFPPVSITMALFYAYLYFIHNYRLLQLKIQLQWQYN